MCTYKFPVFFHFPSLLLHWPLLLDPLHYMGTHLSRLPRGIDKEGKWLITYIYPIENMTGKKTHKKLLLTNDMNSKDSLSTVMTGSN